MSLFASKVANPPKSGFHWIDGYRVEWEPEDVEDWDIGRDDVPEGATPLSWIRPPRLVPVGRLLTPLLPLAKPEEGEASYFYALAEHTGLFRTFASLEPAEETVLQFANRYGGLGIYQGPVIPGDEAEQLTDEALECLDYNENVHGESLSDWANGIERLRSIVALWDILRSEDYPAMEDAIYETDDEICWFDYRKLARSGGRGVRTALSVGRATSSSEKPTGEELCDLGWRGLSRVINKEMVSLRANIALEGSGDAASLKVTIHGLRPTMWFQFANAVAGNKQYEQCIHCQGYFEIGPSAGRKGKQYCSNACKMASYRLRRRERS